ncbi:MAG: glycosyltransferase family 2 protein, partial [Chitinophagaceae bacterium]
MNITGVTIVRNAVLNDYPVVESIRSVLPVVNQMIVSVGDSDDETENLIRGIGSEKIRIVRSTWDLSIRSGGNVLAVETNKALQEVPGEADWILYVQADEVIHEKYHEAIRKAAEMYQNNKKVDGLLFKYLHFYATYDYVGDSRKWYDCETRLIKNDQTITSFKDAQGFRRNGEKIRVVPIDAWVYHY